jgi:hypothetical protein
MCSIIPFLNMVWGIYLMWKAFLNDFDILRILFFYHYNYCQKNQTSTTCSFGSTVGIKEMRRRTTQNSVATRLATM